MLIDKYEDKLGTYLMQLTGKELSGDQTKQVSKFLHTISDFERMGDHALNVARTAKELYDKKFVFSEGSLILINSYAPFSPYHSLQYDSAQLRLPDNLRNVPQEDQNPFAHQDLPRHP